MVDIDWPQINRLNLAKDRRAIEVILNPRYSLCPVCDAMIGQPCDTYQNSQYDICHGERGMDVVVPPELVYRLFISSGAIIDNLGSVERLIMSQRVPKFSMEEALSFASNPKDAEIFRRTVAPVAFIEQLMVALRIDEDYLSDKENDHLLGKRAFYPEDTP